MSTSPSRPLAVVTGAAVLNAGIGAGGALATDAQLEDELRLVDLNVRSTVHLAKYLVRDMVAREIARGRPGAGTDVKPLPSRSALRSEQRMLPRDAFFAPAETVKPDEAVDGASDPSLRALRVVA